MPSGYHLIFPVSPQKQCYCLPTSTEEGGGPTDKQLGSSIVITLHKSSSMPTSPPVVGFFSSIPFTHREAKDVKSERNHRFMDASDLSTFLPSLAL